MNLIYTGKISHITEKKLDARVVQDLTKLLEGKSHHVYFNNYFTSVPLIREPG
jgi:hypothetical protein